jgi:flavin reductase (DIM6/NTAB) family NADH-FMN oxidoreductase RutF
MTTDTALDPRHLRACLSRFTTGVTVVTYTVRGEPRGITVNSFTSVSLDPPLVLVSLARSARASEQAGRVPFAVNVLAADQVDLALQFAGRPRAGARLRWAEDAGSGDTGSDGPPRLAGAVAVFTCRPWRSYDGGDHVLHLGEVTAAARYPGEPLVFTDGRFAMAGLPLFDGPRVLPPDSGSPWLGHACRLHEHATG